MNLNVIERAGRGIIDTMEGVGGTVLTLSRAVGFFTQALRYRVLILEQMLFVGVESLLVVSVVALFAGMIVALQTGHELARFQLEGTIGNIVAASVCREMGPVFAAIIVAARVGSAMAAELGTMKVSEEIDALEAMSINPIRYLVMPRVAAILIMLPILTLYSDLVGMVGGAMVGRLQIGVSYYSFYQRVVRNLEVKDIYIGVLKAAVFALIISSIACSQGLKADSGAQGVGRATTRTVVFSLLFVLIFNYFITSIFY
jgi:phospholipid/cholesterol/gamma-HCH transport system permease protein